MLDFKKFAITASLFVGLVALASPAEAGKIRITEGDSYTVEDLDVRTDSVRYEHGSSDQIDIYERGSFDYRTGDYEILYTETQSWAGYEETSRSSVEGKVTSSSSEWFWEVEGSGVQY
jgi:hypothetical protein